MNILITDDAAFMRMMVKDIIVKNFPGCNIEEAKNGTEAVEKATGNEFDLITMDITMPEMDGIQALKTIIKNKPSQKVIMCSAMGQQAMVIEAIQNGAKGFIVKPFTAERVVEEISKIVS